ncbi:MAG: hypothetical protein WA865_04475 [Spirulinaceae cyanobacterium]
MAQKREGQEIVVFYAPEGLKEKYKRVCSIKGTSITGDLVAYMEKQIEQNEELVDIVERRLNEDKNS